MRALFSRGCSTETLDDPSTPDHAGGQPYSLSHFFATAQCPYNPHLFAPQAELLAFCKKHKIVFNSYSPLGIPGMPFAAGCRTSSRASSATPWATGHTVP